MTTTTKAVQQSTFPPSSRGDHIDTGERLSDIIIPPSDYQYSSNYLDPCPLAVKRESPSRATTQEHDSGVIVDPDSDQFGRQTSQVSTVGGENQSIGPTPGSMMPGKRRPDSLAVRGHEYEELPTSRQHDYPSESQACPPLFTKLNGVQSSHTGSNDHLLFNHGAPPLPVYRKRQNPLYNSNDHEDEANPEVEKKAATRQQHCPCLCPCLLMIVTLTLISLCLSLFTFTKIMWQTDPPKTAMVISPHNHSMQDMREYVQLLQAENTLLEEKVKSLEALVEKLELNSSSQYSTLQQVRQSLDHIEVNSEARLHQLSTQLQNISKMPGPQGPPGSGNLSQCVHTKKSVGSSVFEPYIETGPVPANLAQHTASVILGVECTTDGGLSALLRVVDEQSFPQFICNCSGVVSGSASRQCEMHYWTCPKIS